MSSKYVSLDNERGHVGIGEKRPNGNFVFLFVVPKQRLTGWEYNRLFSLSYFENQSHWTIKELK